MRLKKISAGAIALALTGLAGCSSWNDCNPFVCRHHHARTTVAKAPTRDQFASAQATPPATVAAKPAITKADAPDAETLVLAPPPRVVDEGKPSHLPPVTPKPDDGPAITAPVEQKVEAPVLKPVVDFTAEGSKAIVDPPIKAQVELPPDLTPKTPTVAANSPNPSVALEWSGPETVQVGVANEHTLLVRNTSETTAQKINVRVRMPEGVKLIDSAPRAVENDRLLTWELGDLPAKQERRLTLSLVAPKRGDLNCEAAVAFASTTAMAIKAREPKLQLKLQAADKILVGDSASVTIALRNTGDHPAEKVRLAAVFAEGLDSARGNKQNFEVGTLAAGESRTINVPCVSKGVGPQNFEASVEAEGIARVSDSVVVDVIKPRLDLAFTGPKLRYIDRKATYVLKATNPGDVAVSNVFLTQVVPSGFKYQQAHNGGQYDQVNRTIKWFVGELAAGESKEVKCDLMPVKQGDFTLKARADASRGLKVEQELKAIVEGLSAIVMEVVDLEDPVEINGEVTYQIRVANTGTKEETDIRLICSMPSQMRVKVVNAPQKHEMVNGEMVFEPMAKLAPGSEAVIKITAIAESKGETRLKASLSAPSLIEPIIRVEQTRVYGD
jgi:uncharacterized repeat protein (TIGR01451 family)